MQPVNVAPSGKFQHKVCLCTSVPVSSWHWKALLKLHYITLHYITLHCIAPSARNVSIIDLWTCLAKPVPFQKALQLSQMQAEHAEVLQLGLERGIVDLQLRLQYP